MSILKQELKFLFIFFAFFVLEIILFQNKTIVPSIDFGREAYNPFAILNGAVLYKDIFNIFGPFSYLFNALIYKLFGTHLNSLYLSGYLNAIVLSAFLYLCAKKFLKQNLSRVLIIFFIVYCCFTQSLMNYITPYSYAIVYGLTFFFISLYNFLQYLDNNKKINLILSFIFCGFAISSKYEFCLFALVLLITFLRTKPNLKYIFLNLICLISPTVLLMLFLFAQGLTVHDFSLYLQDFLGYIKSPTLNQFYKGTVYFGIINFKLMLKVFCCSIPIILFCCASFVFLNDKNRILKYFILSVLGLLSILFITHNKTYFLSYTFCYLPLTVFILSIIKFKDIWKNPKYFLLISSSILLSIKVFWLLITTYSYGQYFLPINLLALFVLIQSCILKTEPSKEIFNNFCVWLFIVFIVSTFTINIPRLAKVKYSLKLPKGTIMLRQKDYEQYNAMSDFILKYTSPDDTVVILPESPLLNLMSGRKTDSYYHSLKKENVEAFGEEKIINAFKKNQPKYFIVTIYPFSSFNFGRDYARKTAKWIENNYKLIGFMETDVKVYVFQL